MAAVLNLPEILGRIEIRLAVLGISASAASNAAGKPDAIRNIQRAVKTGNRKGVSIVTLAALAPVLATTEQWLATGQSTARRVVPVMGYVGAGSEAHFYADAHEMNEWVDTPEGGTAKTVAVKIRGESLGEVLDGWYAYYDEVRDPPGDDLAGELCVCGLADGRVLIKGLKRGQGATWTLLSNTEAPIYDRVVKWAAKVIGMRPASARAEPPEEPVVAPPHPISKGIGIAIHDGRAAAKRLPKPTLRAAETKLTRPR